MAQGDTERDSSARAASGSREDGHCSQARVVAREHPGRQRSSCDRRVDAENEDSTALLRGQFPLGLRLRFGAADVEFGRGLARGRLDCANRIVKPARTNCPLSEGLSKHISSERPQGWRDLRVAVRAPSMVGRGRRSPPATVVPSTTEIALSRAYSLRRPAALGSGDEASVARHRSRITISAPGLVEFDRRVSTARIRSKSNGVPAVQAKKSTKWAAIGSAPVAASAAVNRAACLSAIARRQPSGRKGSRRRGFRSPSALCPGRAAVLNSVRLSTMAVTPAQGSGEAAAAPNNHPTPISGGPPGSGRISSKPPETSGRTIQSREGSPPCSASGSSPRRGSMRRLSDSDRSRRVHVRCSTSKIDAKGRSRS